MTDWEWIFNRWIMGRHGGWREGRTFSEPAVRRAISQLSGDTFVDIGANVGDYTLLTWRQYHHNVAFEPSPGARRRMEERIGWRRRFHYFDIHSCALSDHIGEGSLYLDVFQKLGGASTLDPDYDYRPVNEPSVNIKYREKFVSEDKNIRVQLSTLDEHARLFMGTMDVKIDVEGSEFRVLDGMRDSISRDRVQNIIVELHDRERKRELENRLASAFSTRWLDPDHIQGTRLVSR